MKQIYIYLSLLLIGASGFAQGENDNWYFGYAAGLNFSTNPPTPLYGCAMSTLEGVATISSPAGDLLFYTNGATIWNRNHQVMTNGTNLTGGENTQQVIILPHPANDNLYYVFTMGYVNIADWGSNSGPGSYSAYSIIDMSLGTNGTNGLPLGEVTGIKNIPLLNELGQQFTLRSENVAATLHADNKSYWVLFPNAGNMYSYRLDENGFHNTPLVSALPAPLNPMETHMHLRISPNLSPDLNLPYTNFVSISRWNGGLSIPPYNYGIRVCSFDNNTGLITQDYVRTNNFSAYSTEFSGSGTLLYAASYSYGEVICLDLLNPNYPNQYMKFYGNSRECGSIQRATNGEIYIAFSTYNSEPNSRHLGRIVDQESFSGSSVEMSGVFFDAYQRLGLPPLVPILPEIQCLQNIVLGYPEPNSETRNASSSITTNNGYAVSPSQDVALKAGNYVLLQPNTDIKPGSVFLAAIEACTATSARPIAVKNKNNSNDNVIIREQKEKINITPNPAFDKATVSLQNHNITSLTVHTEDGKTVFSKNSIDANSYTLDVSQYQKGVYLISIVNDKGEEVFGKLIKR